MTNEMLDVVDAEDALNGQATRTDVHMHGWWHRGAHILLFDDGGRLLVQKRSADRAASPSLLDCSVSEHVQAGEPYPEAARRGLLEELGVEGVDLQPVVKFRMVYGPNDNEISILFKGTVDPAIVKFDPVEIETIQWLGLDRLKALMKNRPEIFCSWFIEIMNWHWGEPSALTVLPNPLQRERSSL